LPIITSFSQNGLLVCSNLAPGSVASVQWASSLSGPWQTNWAGLGAVTADSNGLIQVSVPMFYRVSGVPNTPPNMALIPAGTFTMGDTLDGESDAIPTNVYVSAFFMETNLVSSSQWETVFSWAVSNGYGFDYDGSTYVKRENQPVQTLDWYDVVKWCNAWSQQVSLSPVYYTDPALTQVYTNGDTDAVYANWAANGYRLPTEAEWEKAARGGLSGQRFPWGDTISESQANYFGCTSCFSYDLGTNSYNSVGLLGGYPYTSPVGYFAAHGYGLYDMAGNVLEWCWDWYGTPYGQPTTTNPTGPSTGSFRVLRGGSWNSYANTLTCAYRGYINFFPWNANANTGFRCVRGH
jgi:formylglycine-generating enzyme